MANWLTVHYPHPYDYDLSWDIYLQDKHKNKADHIKVNDQVFFYELKGNEYLEINHVKYKTDIGRMGIVHIGRVTGVPYARSVEEAQNTTIKRESKNWGIGIPTDAERSDGFISREKLNIILEYKEKNIFTGFPGVKEISNDQANELLFLFGGSQSYFPDEIQEPEKYYEGALQKISVNNYERNTEARKACIAYFGCTCSVCFFNFKKIYGELGADYIHVHHLLPLSEIKEEYKLDPIKDLRPVCPNCHAMIHRAQPILSIKQLKKKLEEMAKND